MRKSPINSVVAETEGGGRQISWREEEAEQQGWDFFEGRKVGKRHVIEKAARKSVRGERSRQTGKLMQEGQQH